VAEFSTWRAYRNFEREVSRNRRYIRTAEAESFLTAVRSTCEARKLHISKGRGFWRAQAGHGWRYEEAIGEDVPHAFLPERMKPLTDRAMEGRANPRGVSVLYLCTNKEASMSEVRPWLGSMISLGHFKTNRKLTIVDCTRDSEGTNNIYLRELPEDERDRIIWSDINRAFTTPVTRSDDTDVYVATQILAELFKDYGFDGIAHRSAFGESSTNLALFDRDCADLTSCQLHEATSVRFNFPERDGPYWVRQATSSTKSAKKGRKK